MLTQFNGMTAHKINECKKERNSLRNNLLEKNHKEQSLKELRVMFESMGINNQDKRQDYRGHDYMFHKFRPEKDDLNEVLGHLPKPKEKREPKKDLKPVHTDGMFIQHRIDKINKFKAEALEANIIRGGKPRVTGSHGY